MSTTTNRQDVSGAMAQRSHEVGAKLSYVTRVEAETDARVVLLHWLHDEDFVARGWAHDVDEDPGDDLNEAALERFRSERSDARAKLERRLRESGENASHALSEAARGLQLALDEDLDEQDFFLEDTTE